MILRNPTESTVSITLDGVDYSVAPQDSVTVPKSIGTRWFRVHGFLQVEETEDDIAPVEETKETKEEVKEKVVDGVINERVNETKELPEAPKPPRARGLLAKLKAAAKGKK